MRQAEGLKPALSNRSASLRSALCGCGGRRRGVAIIMVVLMLAALLAVAGPFALSMYLQERAARHFRDSRRARLIAEGAVAHAIATLLRTSDEAERSGVFPYPWNTPEYDTEEELDVDFSFKGRTARLLSDSSVKFGDPRGTIWSARVEDEQGRINIVSAPPVLLGNLIGSATLTEDLDPSDKVLLLDDAAFFYTDDDPRTVDGRVWAHSMKREKIAYMVATDLTLEGLARNLNRLDNVPIQRAGTLVYDAAARETTDAALRGEFKTLYEMKRYLRPEDFERVYPCVTVHSHREVDRGWFRREEVLGTGDDPPEVRVKDATGFGAGTRVRLILVTNSGEAERLNRVEWARQRRTRGTIRLERPPGFVKGPNNLIFMEAEQRHPVNVNTASRNVLAALFTGVLFMRVSPKYSVSRLEAEAVADFVYKYVRGGGGGAPLATAGDVRKMFYACRASGVAGDEFNRRKVEALIENATVENSIKLFISTTTFCYKCYGNFTVEGTGVVNSPVGEEIARFSMRQLITIPAATSGVWVVASQKDFDEQVDRNKVGMAGDRPLLVTWPFIKPPPQDKEKDYARYISGIDLETGEDPYGHARLSTGEAPEVARGSGGFCEHFRGRMRRLRGSGLVTHDGVELNSPLSGGTSRGFQTGSGGTCEPASFSAWVRPKRLRNRHTIFTASGAAKLTYERTGRCAPAFVLSVWDASRDGRNPAKYYFPCTLEPDEWYHVACQWKGNGPGDAAAWLDGQPITGAHERCQYGPGSTLMGGLADDLNTDSIMLDDASDFPGSGAAVIDAEIVEYGSKTDRSLEDVRRGVRFSFVSQHTSGARIADYGYSVGLASRLFPGNAKVASRLGEGPSTWIGPETRIASEMMPNPNIPPVPPEIPKLLEMDADVIPADTAADLDEFQDSGFLWISGSTRPAGEPGSTDVKRKTEFVYYGKVDTDKNKFEECERDYDTWGTISLGGKEREFLMDGNVKIRQVSICATDLSSYSEGTYVSVRGVDKDDEPRPIPEWIKIEHKISKDATQDERPVKRWYLIGWYWSKSRNRYLPRNSWSGWRGAFYGDYAPAEQEKVLPRVLPDEEKLIPVVRVGGPQCGGHESYHGFDGHELVTPVAGSQVESKAFTITRAHVSGLDFRVSLDDFVGRTYSSGRLLKFPSGELARSAPSRITVGHAGMSVDEVRLERGRASGGGPWKKSVILAYDEDMTPVKAKDDTVYVTRDYLVDNSASPRPPPPPPARRPTPAPPVPSQGVVLIDDEYIYYSRKGGETVIQVPWGPEQEANAKLTQDYEIKEVALEDCIRGVFGTKPAAHRPGAKVAFIEALPLTELTSGLPPNPNKEEQQFTVKNDYGFPDYGYALVMGPKGRDKEIIGWAEKSGTAFSYVGHLRGRFGTREHDHRWGDLALALPFRYWSRYEPDHDGGELAYFQGAHTVKGSVWRSIRWEVAGDDGGPHMERILVRVHCRFDGEPGWDAKPTNDYDGIWEFARPGEHRIRTRSGGPVIADTIEVRVHFEYLPGAWGPGLNDWKRAVRLKNLVVTYGNPLVVRKCDLLEY